MKSICFRGICVCLINGRSIDEKLVVGRGFRSWTCWVDAISEGSRIEQWYLVNCRWSSGIWLQVVSKLFGFWEYRINVRFWIFWDYKKLFLCPLQLMKCDYYLHISIEVLLQIVNLILFVFSEAEFTVLLNNLLQKYFPVCSSDLPKRVVCNLLTNGLGSALKFWTERHSHAARWKGNGI